jgi:transcriptional regulator with XRE-family HTH domain
MCDGATLPAGSSTCNHPTQDACGNGARMALRTEVGPLLRAARIAQATTLRQVAPKAGISYSMLAQIERGGTNTTLDVVDAVAMALGIEIRAAVVGEGEVSAPVPIPATRRALAERFLRVLPSLPDDDLDVFIHEIALWERRYGEKPPK